MKIARVDSIFSLTDDGIIESKISPRSARESADVSIDNRV